MARHLHNRQVHRVVIAVVTPISMLGVRLLLDPYLGGSTTLLPFTLAVFVSAWFGGRRMGLLSTALAAIFAAYFLLPPRGSFLVENRQDQLTLIIFIVISALISFMSGRLWRSELRAAEGVSALTEAENHFRSTFEQAAVGIAHVSPKGEWLQVNRRLCEIMGRGRAELMTTTFQQITHPDDLDLDLDHVRQMLAAEISTYSIEKRYIRKNGPAVWTMLTVSLVRDSDGRPDYFISVIEDINARKQAEAALRDLQAELETRVEHRTRELADANQQLEAFSYTVSHDLRAPLRGIQGFTRALVEDSWEKLDDTERDYLRRVENGASRMERLIDDLLAFSRLSRERLLLTPVPFDSAVNEALHMMAGDLKAANAEVNVSVDACTVQAHRATLVMAIQNLLANGTKFVDRGVRPCLRVWCEKRAGRARLWVDDNGIGIAPEHQDRIFGVFERLHSNDHYPGTGVGLAIVRKGVERMGGEVGVESALRSGSRFWIELGTGEA